MLLSLGIATIPPLPSKYFFFQINFIDIAHNPDDIASVVFIICTEYNILCPYTLDSFYIEKKKQMEDTSGRATEEGSLSQDRQSIDVALTEKNKITIYNCTDKISFHHNYVRIVSHRYQKQWPGLLKFVTFQCNMLS